MFLKLQQYTTSGHKKTDNVTSMNSMFAYCSALKTIYVGENWNTNAAINFYEMFDSCYNLLGSKGTKYDDTQKNNKTFARIDGGINNPGYFTKK